jgi:hypothetical protein
MRPPAEKQAVREVAERLAELLDFLPSEAEVRPPPARIPVDALINVGGRTFAVEWKAASAAAPVAMAAEQARAPAARVGEEVMALVAVPVMGRVGRERFEEKHPGIRLGRPGQRDDRCGPRADAFDRSAP